MSSIKHDIAYTEENPRTINQKAEGWLLRVLDVPAGGCIAVALIAASLEQREMGVPSNLFHFIVWNN